MREEKKGGRIFDIFSSNGQNEHKAASRVRSDERQRLMATQEEEARRNVQGVDNEVNRNLTAVHQTIAKRMLKYLEDSEALKVSTRELKEQVLSPNEPRVRIVRIAEKQNAVPDFQETRSERDRSRQYGEMEGAFENWNALHSGKKLST